MSHWQHILHTKVNTLPQALWLWLVGILAVAAEIFGLLQWGWPALLALSLIILAGVAAILLFSKPQLTFALLLLLLPLHTGLVLIARVELGLSPSVALLLQSWKEGVLLLLVLGLGVQTLVNGKLRIVHSWLFILVVLFMATGLLAIYRAPGWLNGLYALRGTFEPFAVLLLTLWLPLDRAWVKRLTPWLLGVGAVVSAFALFQALALGFDFLWKYYAMRGVLASSFSFMGSRVQRAMGTFASPNQLAIYLAFLLTLILNLVLRKQGRRHWLLGLFGLSFATLLLTVSRSGWLATMAGLGASLLLWRRKQQMLLLILLAAVILIPAASPLELDEHLFRTLQGQDISASYHADIARRNLAVILDQPLGVGLGRVGARTGALGGAVATDESYATESYLLQIAMELGLPGLFLFLTIVTCTGIAIYLNIFRMAEPWSRAWAVSAWACLLAALVDSLFIPALQDLAVSSYLWFFVGLGLRLPSLERWERSAT